MTVSDGGSGVGLDEHTKGIIFVSEGSLHVSLDIFHVLFKVIAIDSRSSVDEVKQAANLLISKTTTNYLWKPFDIGSNIIVLLCTPFSYY
jgi:hypothetical protein